MSAAAPSAFDWVGEVRAQRDASDPAQGAPTLTMEIARSDAGSAPILCLADDGERYWVKFPDNPQGTQTLVAETIVAAVAPLIGAPVVEVRRVIVGAQMAGMRYGPDGLNVVRSGLAHGSRLLQPVVERQGALKFEHRDDNARRIPRLLVLWDWAMGDDEQWLFDESANSSVYSFDHGWWLNANEGPWTPQGLAIVAKAPWATPSRVPTAIDRGELLGLADVLEGVAATEIVSAVSQVPRAWEPDDAMIAAIGETLHRRREGAAARARTLSTRISKGGTA